MLGLVYTLGTDQIRSISIPIAFNIYFFMCVYWKSSVLRWVMHYCKLLMIFGHEPVHEWNASTAGRGLACYARTPAWFLYPIFAYFQFARIFFHISCKRFIVLTRGRGLSFIFMCVWCDIEIVLLLCVVWQVTSNLSWLNTNQHLMFHLVSIDQEPESSLAESVWFRVLWTCKMSTQ